MDSERNKYNQISINYPGVWEPNLGLDQVSLSWDALCHWNAYSGIFVYSGCRTLLNCQDSLPDLILLLLKISRIGIDFRNFLLCHWEYFNNGIIPEDTRTVNFRIYLCSPVVVRRFCLDLGKFKIRSSYLILAAILQQYTVTSQNVRFQSCHHVPSVQFPLSKSLSLFNLLFVIWKVWTRNCI